MAPIYGVLLTVLLLFCIFVNGYLHSIITARIGYVLARDNGIPASAFFKKLNPSTKNPARLIWLIFVLESFFCLLPLASSQAFNALVSALTVFLHISYLIPISLRLYLKLKGEDPASGPYTIGIGSPLVGLLSFLWLFYVFIVLFLPQTYDPVHGITWQNFNFTSIIVAIVLFLAAFYWSLPECLGGARHKFSGPPTESSLND